MMSKRSITGALIVLLVIGGGALLWFLKARRSSESVVIGEEVARAAENEERRLDREDLPPSPLPDGAFRRHKGEWGLLNPQPEDLDEALRALCETYAGQSAEERAMVRAAISLDDNYRLIEFARRSAAFGLRSEDPAIIRDGLTALAMLELKRTDYRDVLVAIALLNHSAEGIGRDAAAAAAALRSAAELAEAELAELMTNFVQRDPEGRNLKDSWGFLEVETQRGPGFAGWEGSVQDPDLDLLARSMRIAGAIEEEAYLVNRISLGAVLPEVWLKAPNHRNLRALLAGRIAGANISAILPEEAHADAASQSFTAFLVRLDSPPSAQALLTMSQEKQADDFTMLGFAHDDVFCLVVARSFVMGVESFENAESMRRFREPIQAALELAGAPED